MVEFQEGVKALLSKWSIEEVAVKPLSNAKEAPDCKLRRILGAEENMPKRGGGLADLPPIRMLR
jgi:hypothetical protein